jgi:acyl-[acyl-carrier-protein]-phospholipid O-acyltransferase/long-chain-fatty-acid--[acyl-carrier-protein] ligase
MCWRRHEINVGVLIPPSTGRRHGQHGLGNRPPRGRQSKHNSVSNEIMNHCLREAGIRHVLTTRKVSGKIRFSVRSRSRLSGRLAPQSDFGDKTDQGIGCLLVPSRWLERALDLHRLSPDDMLPLSSL